MAQLPVLLTLRNDAVLLRDWRVEDASILASVAGDPDVCRFTSVPWTYSASAAAAWVERQHAYRAAGTGVALAVTLGEAAPAVGNVNLVGFSSRSSEASLGYWLAPAARGQGLATRSARLLCDWGLDELGLTRIELAILPQNESSQRVAERLGATCDGLRRGSHHSEGRDFDMLIYSLRTTKSVTVATRNSSVS